MSQYFMSTHVFACVSDDQIVLLDLRRDRYLAVGADAADPLAALIDGWPTRDAQRDLPAASDSASKESQQLLHHLLAHGLITSDAIAGRSRSRRIEVAVPIAQFIPEVQFVACPPTDGRSRREFARAAVLAGWMRRFWSIDRIVKRIGGRKARQARRHPFDFDAARSITRAFARLLPYTLTTRDSCLYESLALIELLARYHLYPSLVFGVQTGPFGAHCWVQYGDTVINDSVQKVRCFTPILAV